MALTRQLLKDLQLGDEAIEQIIAAHVSTIEALKSERDAATAELEALRATSNQSAAEVQAAFDAYRTQVEKEKQTHKAFEWLRLSMLQAGCNEKALDLLLQSVDQADLEMDNGMLKNGPALVADLRSRYADFFAQPVRMAAPTLQPPISSGGALTRDDLSRMSADDINRNWNAVKSVLAKGAI